MIQILIAYTAISYTTTATIIIIHSVIVLFIISIIAYILATSIYYICSIGMTRPIMGTIVLVLFCHSGALPLFSISFVSIFIIFIISFNYLFFVSIQMIILYSSIAIAMPHGYDGYLNYCYCYYYYYYTFI